MSLLGQNGQTKQNLNDTTIAIKEVVIKAHKEKVELIKFNVPLKYVPVSTNSIKKSTLENRNITDIKEASRFLPGVRVNNSYGGFLTLTVRGFSRAPILIDGIRDERTMINSFPLGDLEFAQNIELIKGPASVLCGHSAIGGVINIKREDPSGKREIRAKISAGSYNYKQTSITAKGSIFKRINLLAGVNYSGEDGWRHSGDTRLSIYFGASTSPWRGAHLELRGGYRNDFYGTEIGLAPAMSNDVYQSEDEKLYLKMGESIPGLNRRWRYNNPSDFFYNRSNNISLRYTQRLTKSMEITNYLAFNHDDIDYFGTEYLKYPESDDAIYNHYYIKGDKKRYINLDTLERNSPLRFSHLANYISNNFSLKSDFTVNRIKIHSLIGHSYVYMSRNSFSGYNLGTDVTGPGLYSRISVMSPRSDMGYMDTRFSKATVTYDHSHGIFTHNLIELSKSLKIMLAGRFDYYKYQRSTSPVTTGNREYDKGNLAPFSYAKTTAFTYRAGLVYIPHESMSLFTSVSSFFNPYRSFYSENNIYINSKGEQFYPTKDGKIFDPENGNQVEVGATYSPINGVEVNTSLFYILRENTTKTLGTTQAPNEDGQMVTKTIIGQVGRSDSKGFDIEVNVNRLKNTDITIGYSYTDAKNRSLKSNPFMDSDNLENSRFTGVPENTFYLLTSHTIDRGYFKSLGIHLSVNYMDKVYRNISKNLYFPSFWLSDISFSYPILDGLKCNLSINNLFDNRYFDQSLGMQIAPAPGRNFKVALNYTIL